MFLLFYFLALMILLTWFADYSGGHAATVGSVLVTNLKTGFSKGEWDRVEVSFASFSFLYSKFFVAYYYYYYYYYCYYLLSCSCWNMKLSCFCATLWQCLAINVSKDNIYLVISCRFISMKYQMKSLRSW